MGGVVDAVKDFVDDVVEVVVDVHVAFIDNVLTPDILIDSVLDFAEVATDVLTLGLVDDLTDDVFDFARDINTGMEYLTDQALTGDLNAIGQLIVVAGSIALTVASFGSTAPATSAVLAGISAGMTSGATALLLYNVVMITTVAMSVYSLYGIAVSFAELGAMIASGGLMSLFSQLNTIKDAMNLATVNSWVNGTMGRWMAGGELYDAPRAGDLLFNPTGTQNTTKFLGLQDTNSNFYIQTSILGHFHTPHKLKFGAKAGDEGFSVSSLVKG